MRSGIFLLVVVLALAALAALLWWRFKGSGLPAAPAATATRNHHSLRTFHYAPAGAIPKAAVSAEAAAAGAVLASLLPPEDIEAPAGQLPEEAVTAASEADSPQVLHPDEPDAAAEPATEETLRPASIRHAAGAVALLLDAVDESPSTVPSASQPASDPDDEPAEALFHNPITAPAPTANDQANRAAEIALRQQRRARMSKDAAAQRAALNDLFPGAGSPVPTAKPS